MKQGIFHLFSYTSRWQKNSKPLLWLLFYLTKKKQLKIKITKHKRDHIVFDHGFNGKKKKACYHSFLRNVFQFKLVFIFSVAMTIIILQISINFYKKLSSCSVLLQNICCRQWARLKSFWILLGKHIFIDATRQHLMQHDNIWQHTLHSVKPNLSFQDFDNFIKVF